MNAPLMVALEGETDPLRIAQKELRFECVCVCVCVSVCEYVSE